MSETPSRTVHIRIAGRVQGVGFRYWMEGEALSLGLAGWARNRRDGTVEAVISGEADAVETMLSRCRRGPDAARVDEVAILGELGGTCTRFDILPTA